MNTKELLKNPELVQAAPIAVSGALGAEFWDEVERLDAQREPLIKARETVETR